MTSGADSSGAPPPGSLRALIAAASNGDTIDFAPSMEGQTITLSGSTLVINKDLTITSGGVPGIVISGDNAVTVFTVSAGATATIDELTISNGLAQPSTPGGPSQGGGILNKGTLTVSACTLVGNQASVGTNDGGGGIANLGTLTIVNSTLTKNNLATNALTSSGGGAIFSTGSLTAINCTVVANDATNGSGGGFDVTGGSTVLNTIVTNNSAASAPDVGGTLSITSNDLFTTDPSIANGNSNLFYTNPMLDPNGLQDNGGPTQTIAEEIGSPAIDAGNAAFVTNPPFQGPSFTDQRGTGYLRVIANKTDIGAYEDQSLVHYVPYGSEPGVETSVAIVDPSTGQMLGEFSPWAGFTGGAHVALGDITGEGVPDLIVGSGTGGITAVLVYDGDSVLENPNDPTLIAAFFPYGAHFTGGAFVAAGSLDGGPRDEIITGAGSGGGPQVNVYSAAQIQADQFSSPALAFYAYAPRFTGGVHVATGDVNGDGLDDLITAPGAGGGPQVNIYLGTADGSFLSGLALAFYSFLPNYTGGVNLAVGDVTGDGKADLFCGADTGSTEVNVFSGDQLFGGTPDLTPVTAFYGYFQGDPSFPQDPELEGVQLFVTLAAVIGPKEVPVLLSTTSHQLASQSSSVNEYEAQSIFQNPGVPPTPVNTSIYPFGFAVGSSSQRAGGDDNGLGGKGQGAGSYAGAGMLSVGSSVNSGQPASNNGMVSSSLTMTQLQPAIDEAIRWWDAAGITAAQDQLLHEAHFTIDNPGSGLLGYTTGDNIQISPTADGYGWFLDPSSGRDAFWTAIAGGLTAAPGTAAVQHMDLTTVVAHELGHILGIKDQPLPGDLMALYLPTGVRRMPSAQDVFLSQR